MTLVYLAGVFIVAMVSAAIGTVLGRSVAWSVVYGLGGVNTLLVAIIAVLALIDYAGERITRTR